MRIIQKHESSAEQLKEVPFESENELEEAIQDHPELLNFGNGQPALLGRQLHLPDAGILDLLFLAPSRDIMAVEVKLGRNPEGRRQVLAQVLDYASDISTLSFHQLEELINGIPEDLRADEDLPRQVDQSLRAARVQVIVVIDDAPDSLRRLLDFVNTHSVFELGLVEVKKYRNGAGELFYAAHSTVSIQRQEEPAARKKRSSDYFLETVEAFEEIRPSGFVVMGPNAHNWRAYHPDGQQWQVHYEFQDLGNGVVGVEIHLEGVKAHKAHFETLQEFRNILSVKWKDVSVEFDPTWCSGKGRLALRNPVSKSGQDVAELMANLIKATSSTLWPELSV